MGAAALPIITAVAGIIGAGSTAYGVYKSATAKKPKIDAPPVAPSLTTEIPGGAQTAKEIKRRRYGRRETILTRGGALSEDQGIRPTLLGS